jgi:hypothetical protein
LWNDWSFKRLRPEILNLWARLGPLTKSSGKVGWGLQDVWSEPSTLGPYMTQTQLILILSAYYVSGGQGAKGTRVSFVLSFFLFPGGVRVEIGASGLYCGEAAQTPS